MISISNILIAISFVFTLLAMNYTGLYNFGMNQVFLDQGKYYYLFLQFFISNFLHGGLLHLLFNSLFIYIFGNQLEYLIGKKKFIIFFLFTVFFNGLAILYFAHPLTTTVGISGFAMALLSYYTLELRSRNNPDWKGGIAAIIINVGIGFHPEISLVGHLAGAIAGIIFYYITKDFFRKLMQPVDSET